MVLFTHTGLTKPVGRCLTYAISYGLPNFDVGDFVQLISSVQLCKKSIPG